MGSTFTLYLPVDLRRCLARRARRSAAGVGAGRVAPAVSLAPEGRRAETRAREFGAGDARADVR